MNDAGRPQIIAAQYLPNLSNWVPFSTTDTDQARRNLVALVNLARQLSGAHFSDWLNRLDSLHQEKLRRNEDANLWADRSEANQGLEAPEPGPRTVGGNRAHAS